MSDIETITGYLLDIQRELKKDVPMLGKIEYTVRMTLDILSK